MKFDSKEEKYFYDWLKELDSLGYIKDITDQPRFDLLDSVSININKVNKSRSYFINEEREKDGKKRKLKSKDYHLLRGLSYTPDFKIVWNEKARGIFYFLKGDTIYDTPITKYLKTRFLGHKKNGEHVTIIEIKGTFAARHNSTNIKFPLLQKFMYHYHNIYVNKIMPLHKKKGLFAKTFTPKTYLTTDKTNKKRKIHWKIKSVHNYLEEATKQKKYIDERIEK